MSAPLCSFQWLANTPLRLKCLWVKVFMIFILLVGKWSPRESQRACPGSHLKASLSWLISSFLFHQKMWNLTENWTSTYKDLPQNSLQSRYAGSFHSVCPASNWMGVFDEGVGGKTMWHTIIKTPSKSQQLQSDIYLHEEERPVTASLSEILHLSMSRIASRQHIYHIIL